MIQKNFLSEIIQQQSEALQAKGEGMIRDKLAFLPDVNNYALIVSGIRRCGKSTLLHQLLKRQYIDTLHVNFDDPRSVSYTHLNAGI